MTYWGKHRDARFWIENASVDWNETQAPFHTVARLTLLPKSQLPADASEALYFDVTGNSTADSTPLGSVRAAAGRGSSKPDGTACRNALAQCAPDLQAWANAWTTFR